MKKLTPIFVSLYLLFFYTLVSVSFTLYMRSSTETTQKELRFYEVPSLLFTAKLCDLLPVFNLNRNNLGSISIEQICVQQHLLNTRQFYLSSFPKLARYELRILEQKYLKKYFSGVSMNESESSFWAGTTMFYLQNLIEMDPAFDVDAYMPTLNLGSNDKVAFNNPVLFHYYMTNHPAAQRFAIKLLDRSSQKDKSTIDPDECSTLKLVHLVMSNANKWEEALKARLIIQHMIEQGTCNQVNQVPTDDLDLLSGQIFLLSTRLYKIDNDLSSSSDEIQKISSLVKAKFLDLKGQDTPERARGLRFISDNLKVQSLRLYLRLGLHDQAKQMFFFYDLSTIESYTRSLLYIQDRIDLFDQMAKSPYFAGVQFSGKTPEAWRTYLNEAYQNVQTGMKANQLRSMLFID